MPARALAADAVTLGTVVPGLEAVDAGLLDPPDVQVAAGPGTVMELTNGAGRIWRTDGGTAQATSSFTLEGFFASGTANARIADPRVLYDAASGRWFASAFDVDTNTIMLNVSRTSDPAGGWELYAFPSSTCPDQPRIGVDDEVVVIAADAFTSCGEGEIGFFLGGRMWVVDKADLVAGRRPAAFVAFGPDDRFASLTPVQSLGPSTTEYVVSVDDVSSGVVHLLGITGVPPAAVTRAELGAFPIRELNSPPDAQQPDGTPLETNDNRVLDAVWENGRVALAANGTCVPVGGAGPRACARVITLSTTPPHELLQDVDVAPPGADTFYPALRPDSQGNLVVVFGLSSATAFPSLGVLGLSQLGQQTEPTLLASGTAPHRTSRFGDYFGAARDPLDPRRVWVAGELGTSTPGWSTALGAVTVDVTQVPPPPADTTAPSVRALAAHGRRGARVRLAYRVSDDSGPTRETVTVRRRGRTTYTVKTRLAQGPVRTISWRAPRRLPGPFSFCVRAVDAAGNVSSSSCAAIRLR